MRHIKINSNIYLCEATDFYPKNFIFSVLEISLVEKKYRFKKNNFNTSKNLFYLSQELPENSEEVEIHANDILRPSKKYIFTCALYGFSYYFYKRKNLLFTDFINLLGEQTLETFNKNIENKIQNSIFNRSYRLN